MEGRELYGKGWLPSRRQLSSSASQLVNSAVTYVEAYRTVVRSYSVVGQSPYGAVGTVPYRARVRVC